MISPERADRKIGPLQPHVTQSDLTELTQRLHVLPAILAIIPQILAIVMDVAPVLVSIPHIVVDIALVRANILPLRPGLRAVGAIFCIVLP